MPIPRCLLVLLLGVLPLGWAPAHAEDAPEPVPARVPMLYEVDTTPRIFLLGTLHLADERLLQHPPALAHVIETAQAVYTEMTLDPAQLPLLAARLLLPEGTRLSEVLPPPLHARTQALFRRWSVDLQDRLKIWAIALQAQGLGSSSDETFGRVMDVVLAEEARTAGTLVGGLETALEQNDVFDTLSLEDQRRMLRHALDLAEHPRRSAAALREGLVRTYLRGDPEALRRALFTQFDLDDPFLRDLYVGRLFDRRNVRLVRRLLEKASRHPEKTTLAAIGGGHLAGPQGMLALLRRTGFRVRKIETLADLRRPWPALLPPPVVRERPRQRYRRVGPFCVPMRCVPVRCAPASRRDR